MALHLDKIETSDDFLSRNPGAWQDELIKVCCELDTLQIADDSEARGQLRELLRRIDNLFQMAGGSASGNGRLRADTGDCKLKLVEAGGSTPATGGCDTKLGEASVSTPATGGDGEQNLREAIGGTPATGDCDTKLGEASGSTPATGGGGEQKLHEATGGTPATDTNGPINPGQTAGEAKMWPPQEPLQMVGGSASGHGRVAAGGSTPATGGCDAKLGEASVSTPATREDGEQKLHEATAGGTPTTGDSDTKFGEASGSTPATGGGGEQLLHEATGCTPAIDTNGGEAGGDTRQQSSGGAARGGTPGATAGEWTDPLLPEFTVVVGDFKIRPMQFFLKFLKDGGTVKDGLGEVFTDAKSICLMILVASMPRRIG